MAAMRHPRQESGDVYYARFLANLRYLVEDLYTVPQAARYSGITDQGVRNVIRGIREPKMPTALDIWVSLGADPADMFMEPSEFRRKVNREALTPFFVQRAPSSRPSSLPSPAARGGRRATESANINSATRKLLNWPVTCANVAA